MEKVKPRKTHSHRSDGESVGFSGVARRAFIGVGAAIVSMLMLALVSSGLCMLSPDPAALTLPVGIAIFFLSSVIGGAVSGAGQSKDKAATVFSGIICGFALVIFSGVGAVTQELLSPDSTHEIGVAASMLTRCAAIPLSAVSAYAASIPRKKRRRRR